MNTLPDKRPSTPPDIARMHSYWVRTCMYIYTCLYIYIMYPKVTFGATSLRIERERESGAGVCVNACMYPNLSLHAPTHCASP